MHTRIFKSAILLLISVVLFSCSGGGSNTEQPVTTPPPTAPAALPDFKYLPILTPVIVNGVANYTLNVEENIDVIIDTPEGSWTTPMKRYNGLQLPPVIVATRGDSIAVEVNNNLTISDEHTTVHWHGFKIPGSEDGGPDFPIVADESKTYSFSLLQPAASLWFHPHAHGTTAIQVYQGLAGAFILTDDITENLEANNQLPSDEFDIALLIQDRQFAPDTGNTGERELIYEAGNGMLGDYILVNGVQMPALELKTSQYRFRLYNGSNARTYDFALDNGANFFVVGTDGGLLNIPISTNQIMLGAGERAEIVIDFRSLLGQQVKLISQAFDGGGMMMGGNTVNQLDNGDPFDVMRFDITTEATDPVTLYSNLPAEAEVNTRLTAAEASTSRDFVMSMEMAPGGGMEFMINGLLFDINRIDESVASGATEIWEISNTSSMAHPFHAHAIQWQILDRGPTNGFLAPAADIDLGWKDTVLVQPGETVRFIGRFDPVINTGVYMYHCHILEHEESGMMGTFEVLP